MIYYNKIKKEQTNFRFRFKTEEEFINQCGEYWLNCVPWNNNNEMDYLFGVDLKDNIEYIEILSHLLTELKTDICWLITYDMLIENIPNVFLTIYNKKQLIYE